MSILIVGYIELMTGLPPFRLVAIGRSTYRPTTRVDVRTPALQNLGFARR